MTTPALDRLDGLPIADAAWHFGPDGLVAVDPETETILDVNPQAERLFARSRDQLVGQPAHLVHAAVQGQPGAADLELVHFCTWQSRDGRDLKLTAVRNVAERRANEYELQRREWALAAIRGATWAATEAESESDLLEAICRGLTADTPYTVAFVALAVPDAQRDVTIAGLSGDRAEVIPRITWDDEPSGRGVTGRAIRLQTTQVIRDVRATSDLSAFADTIAKATCRAGISVPLPGIRGALTIYARDPDAFGAFERSLFEDVARQLVLGMQVRRQRCAMQAALEQTIAAIAATIEHRDPYTAGHGRAVGELARRIGAEMGFTEDRCHGLFLAGLVHDVGKIQIPTEILSKPTALWPEELELLKTHAEAGYEILRAVDFPWPIADATRQHHERLDGSGYPQKLRGEEIITEARILAVADVVDSMCGRRPYRPALGMERALAELRRAAGTTLDSAVVDAMLRIAAADEDEQ